MLKNHSDLQNNCIICQISKRYSLNIYKFKTKFSILVLLSVLILGCSNTQPERSNSVLFSFITPQIRISDAGFIHRYANGTQVQIYSSGTLILNLKLAQNICINSACMSRQSFNTKYLNSPHYNEILDDIIAQKAIYDSLNLIQTDCGFRQDFTNFRYEVCDKTAKFIDSKNRIKIIIRELQ